MKAAAEISTVEAVANLMKDDSEVIYSAGASGTIETSVSIPGRFVARSRRQAGMIVRLSVLSPAGRGKER